MSKFRNKDDDNNGRKTRKPQRGERGQNFALGEALATIVIPQPVQTEEELKSTLFDLFDGVLGEYRFYGMTSELRMFTPRDTSKPAYPMLFIEHMARDHILIDVVGHAMNEHEFGISLDDLRYHPDDVEWWAPTEAAYHAKRAFAYYLHGKEIFIEVAKKWWGEKRKREAMEASANKVNALRAETTKQQLRSCFEALTKQNAIQIVRYVPGKFFGIEDEQTGEALYVSTDSTKIYVEEIDPGHPLVSINPIGLFVNRAALRNPVDPDIYTDMADTDLAKRAYTLRCYLRSHPLIAEALKPAKAAQAMKVEVSEDAQPSNIFAFPFNQESGQEKKDAYLGKTQGCADSAIA